MKILVTGGGGFLGFAIVRILIARGDHVVVLCRGRYSARDEINVATIRGDIADASAVREAADGCQAIIHTAAKAGMWGAYDLYHRTNVVGTENVIAAKQAGVDNYIVKPFNAGTLKKKLASVIGDF